MTRHSLPLAAIGLAALIAATPSAADSLASSASSAGSASLGSVSDSFKGSSNSSTGNKPVAAGDYRVIEVAELAEREGMLRLKLAHTEQPGDAGELWLTLPQRALAARPLAAGTIVNVQLRPYGYEFARASEANQREAFFLVLADDWQRELAPRALAL